MKAKKKSKATTTRAKVRDLTAKKASRLKGGSEPINEIRGLAPAEPVSEIRIWGRK